LDSRIVMSGPHAVRLYNLGVRHLLNLKNLLAANPVNTTCPGSEKVNLNEQFRIQSPCQAKQRFLNKYLRPSYAVWTYYDLPCDLKTDFQTPQGRLIESIRTSLGWSSDSMTYWPLAREKDNVLVPDSDTFLQGLEVISPAFIFCFGARAFNVLLSEQPFVYGKHVKGYLTVLALPALQAMLPDNRLLKNFAWQTLRTFSPPGSI